MIYPIGFKTVPLQSDKYTTKGIVIRFLLQVTAYSRQQLTRLIHQYPRVSVIQQSVPHKPAGFKQK